MTSASPGPAGKTFRTSRSMWGLLASVRLYASRTASAPAATRPDFDTKQASGQALFGPRLIDSGTPFMSNSICASNAHAERPAARGPVRSSMMFDSQMRLHDFSVDQVSGGDVLDCHPY